MWNDGTTLSQGSQVWVLTCHIRVQVCVLVTYVSRLYGHPVYPTMLVSGSVGEERRLGPLKGNDKDSGIRLPEPEFCPYLVEAPCKPLLSSFVAQVLYPYNRNKSDTIL